MRKSAPLSRSVLALRPMPERGFVQRGVLVAGKLGPHIARMSDGLHHTVPSRKTMCSIVENIEMTAPFFPSCAAIFRRLVVPAGSVCEADIAAKCMNTTVQIGLKDGFRFVD